MRKDEANRVCSEAKCGPVETSGCLHVLRNPRDGSLAACCPSAPQNAGWPCPSYTGGNVSGKSEAETETEGEEDVMLGSKVLGTFNLY